jgi:hypothetical protein
VTETGSLISVQRKWSLFGIGETWRIMIDGEEAARIRNNETISIGVQVGEHLVVIDNDNHNFVAKMFGDSIVSKPLNLKMEVGQETAMACGYDRSGAEIWLRMEKTLLRRVVETGRYEVPVATEIRAIDNSRGISPLVRTFRMSREWTKSFTLGSEQSITATGTAALGLKLAELRMQAERRIVQQYSAVGQEQRTFEDSVTITVAPRTRSEITFVWKEIRQRGYVEQVAKTAAKNAQACQARKGADWRRPQVQLSRLPFELVLGLTYDPRQVDTPL